MTTSVTPEQSNAVAENKKISSVFLDGTSRLVVEKKIMDKNTKTSKFEIDSYPLTPVTPDEILDLRVSGKPCFILKNQDSYFYTEIPKFLNLVSNDILGTHKCPYCKHFFSSNAPCPKSSNPSFSWFTRRLHDSKTDISILIEIAIEQSSRLETFPFIIKGYETFNCHSEAFVVNLCSDYNSFIRKKAKNSYY